MSRDALRTYCARRAGGRRYDRGDRYEDRRRDDRDYDRRDRDYDRRDDRRRDDRCVQQRVTLHVCFEARRTSH